MYVVDPNKVKDKTYRVTFSDQIVNYVPVTESYDVIDYANGTLSDTLIKAPLSASDTLKGDFDKYRFDGVYLSVENDWQVKYDTSKSKWNKIHPVKDYKISFTPFSAANVQETGIAYPRDYNLIFDDSHTAADTSTEYTITYNNQPFTIPKVNSNFRIVDPATGKAVSFAYLDRSIQGKFSYQDALIFLQKTKNAAGQDTTIITWYLQVSGADSSSYQPTAGDTLKMRVKKPFSSADQLQITTTSASVNNNLAASQLDKIRVVPNPYIATTTQEAPLPPTITSGRGDRKISFIHLPKNSKIYIFTVRGELVKTLEMPPNQSINDGSVDWDLRSRENIEVAYGVYFYLVDAPGVGKKTGKLAIIK